MMRQPDPTGAGAEVDAAVRALAEPLRARIVELLAGEQLCTCHLVGEIDEVAGAQLLAGQELDDAGAQRFSQGPDRGIDLGAGAGRVRLPHHHAWMISARSDVHLARAAYFSVTH